MNAFTRIDRRRERPGAVDGRRCHNGAHLETGRREMYTGLYGLVQTCRLSAG